MKLNNFFKQLAFVMTMSVVINACSSFSKCNNTATHSHENVKLDHFEHTGPRSNKILDEQMQSKTQELKSSNVIYFSLDNYDISSHFFYVLNIHANFLYNNPLYHIKIEGHADERGTPEYNIALGERRANSVKLYLQSKGVLSEQMLTVSYGKERPAVLGQDEAAYAKNRRVVLIYEY